MTHDQIIELMRMNRKVALQVRRVGKIPDKLIKKEAIGWENLATGES